MSACVCVSKRERARDGWGRRELQLIKGREREEEKRRESEKMLQEKGLSEKQQRR